MAPGLVVAGLSWHYAHPADLAASVKEEVNGHASDDEVDAKAEHCEAEILTVRRAWSGEIIIARRRVGVGNFHADWLSAPGEPSGGEGFDPTSLRYTQHSVCIWPDRQCCVT